jgi:hypothetical protein
MKRKHMVGCYCCCECEFQDDYLSPNIPKTELSITGNHPANLVAYIEYSKSTKFGDEWNCSGWLNDLDRRCCIGGSALLDQDESDHIWQDDFCCQQNRSSSADYEVFSCCSFPGQEGWIKVREGSVSALFANAGTTTHAVWYRKISVRMYTGIQDDCCGVFVEVCLSFRRVLLNTVCGERKATDSYTIVCDENSCGTIPPENCDESYVLECYWPDSCDDSYDIESGDPKPCPEPLNANDYISLEGDPQEDSWPHYSILRRKFIPGDPECTERNLPVTSVTLTEDDNVFNDPLGLNLGVCDVCPITQEDREGNTFRDRCVPSLVFYDGGEWTTPDSCCPDRNELFCDGVPKTPGLMAILGACYRSCDNLLGEGEYRSGGLGVTESTECTLNGGTPGIFDNFNDFSPCYMIRTIDVLVVWETSNVTHSVTNVCSIDSCSHLLFGEIEDTWNLSITLPP